MIGIGAWKQRLPRPGEALPGRAEEMPLHNRHFVLGTPLRDRFEGLARIQFGMGCFWGVERRFWTMPGVVTTAAGYAGGHTPNPTYRAAARSARRGGAGRVRPGAGVVRDPAGDVLENHDPTCMRQGNTRHRKRSAISTTTSSTRCAGQPRCLPGEAGRGRLRGHHHEIRSRRRSITPRTHQQYRPRTLRLPRAGRHRGVLPDRPGRVAAPRARPSRAGLPARGCAARAAPPGARGNRVRATRPPFRAAGPIARPRSRSRTRRPARRRRSRCPRG